MPLPFRRPTSAGLRAVRGAPALLLVALAFLPCSAAGQASPADSAPSGRVGEAVEFGGTVNSAPIGLGRTLWTLSVQDSAGGTHLFSRDSAMVAGLRPGDRVRGTGRIVAYGGDELIRMESLERLGTGPPVQPRPLLAADVADGRYRGQLVQLSGTLEVGEREGRVPRLELHDRSGAVRIQIGHALIGDPRFLRRLMAGGDAELVGVVARSGDGAEQVVLPRTAEDVRLIPPPPYRAIARWAVVSVLLLALLYLAYRRRGAERRVSEMSALSAELRRSEKAHRESETRLRLFLDRTPAILWSTDRDLRITFSRGGGLDRAGIPGDGIVGQTIRDYFAGVEEESPIPDAHRRALAGERITLQTSWADRAYEVRIEPSYDDDRRIVGTSAVALDVTDRRAAEESLRQSERHFRALIENAHEIVSVVDASGEIRYQSPGVRQVLGFEPHDMVGGRALAIVHPADAPRVEEALHTLLREPHRTLTLDARCRHRDGEWRHLELVATNLLDDPAVRGLVVNSRDVTGRREAEEALRIQTAYHEQLFEGAPEGIVLLDREDRVLRANAEFVRMFGFEGVDIRNRPINSLIVPEDQWEEASRYTRCATEGERVSAERIRLRSDGTPVEVSILATPVRVEGRAIALYGIYRDITERKDAEEALRRREKLLADAEHLAHVGSWEYDVFTDRVHWSDELWRIYGLAPGTKPASYERFQAMVHADDRERILQSLNASVLAGETFSAEYRIVRPDGTVRMVTSRVDTARDEVGNPVRLIGTTQDVTEWKQLEEQFLHAQKMEAVGRLAGGIAHDFNNLLTGIKGYAELLLTDLPESSPHRMGAEEIDRAADRASALTNQLLAYSRRQVMQPRALDLNEVVESAGSMLRRLVGEHIDFRTSLAPRLGAVLADPVQLDQVLMNLVVNARDAMPDGGTLTIETRPGGRLPKEAAVGGRAAEGCSVVLSVVDTGHGMDEATISRIFEPFFTTKDTGKGTGLGLSTVYGIVRQTGGDVTVRSVPGRGTAFHVLLPCIEPAADGIALGTGVGPARTEAAPAPFRATVLLVEDDDGVRTLVRRILERAGHAPLVARSGSEALALAAEHAGGVDLLISDVVMPGMSGPELAERLRAVRPSLRVIFVSGYTDDTIADLGSLTAESAFLQKPFSPRELADVVNEVLGRAA